MATPEQPTAVDGEQGHEASIDGLFDRLPDELIIPILSLASRINAEDFRRYCDCHPTTGRDVKVIHRVHLMAPVQISSRLRSIALSEPSIWSVVANFRLAYQDHQFEQDKNHRFRDLIDNLVMGADRCKNRLQQFNLLAFYTRENGCPARLLHLVSCVTPSAAHLKELHLPLVPNLRGLKGCRCKVCQEFRPVLSAWELSQQVGIALLNLLYNATSVDHLVLRVKNLKTLHQLLQGQPVIKARPHRLHLIIDESSEKTTKRVRDFFQNLMRNVIDFKLHLPTKQRIPWEPQANIPTLPQYLDEFVCSEVAPRLQHFELIGGTATHLLHDFTNLESLWVGRFAKSHIGANNILFPSLTRVAGPTSLFKMINAPQVQSLAVTLFESYDCNESSRLVELMEKWSEITDLVLHSQGIKEGILDPIVLNLFPGSTNGCRLPCLQRLSIISYPPIGISTGHDPQVCEGRSPRVIAENAFSDPNTIYSTDPAIFYDGLKIGSSLHSMVRERCEAGYKSQGLLPLPASLRGALNWERLKMIRIVGCQVSSSTWRQILAIENCEMKWCHPDPLCKEQLEEERIAEEASKWRYKKNRGVIDSVW